jgi:hypothetical protein
MAEPQQIGALKANRPLVRADLDRLLANCGGAPEAVLQLGCTTCQGLTLHLTYSHGLLVAVCPACELAVASVAVAGVEFLMLERILAILDPKPKP